MADLNPKVMGSAWPPWVRPTMMVPACWPQSSARRRMTSAKRFSTQA